MKNKSPKKVKLTFVFWRNFILGVFAVFIIFLLYDQATGFLKTSDYFIVKSIAYSPSLRLMERASLSGVIGKNLFDIDLNGIQRELQMRYPKFSNLRVLKKFPNQIMILAQERVAFAQVKIGGQWLALDQNGVILSLGGSLDEHLPLIIGIDSAKKRLTAGALLDQSNVLLGLRIVKTFYSEKMLANYFLLKVDLDNASQIFLHVSGVPKITIDQETFARKLKILGPLLVQIKSEMSNVKYIDLRFDEPVLGKND